MPGCLGKKGKFKHADIFCMILYSVAVMCNLSRHLTKVRGSHKGSKRRAEPTVRPILINLSGMYGFEIAHCVAMAAGCITWLIGRYKGSVSARTNFASDADSIYHTLHAHRSNCTLIHDWGHHTMMGCNWSPVPTMNSFFVDFSAGMSKL